MNEYDYIIDAFTKEGENTNLEVNNLNVSCITSKENKFELDSNGNLTVQSLTVKNNNNIDKETMLNFVYPVGSIYMSVNETNPSTLFGGTWVQLKDRFLLGAGSTYVNGKTGGEATHKLTVDEMPKHRHTVNTIYPFVAGADYTGVPNSNAKSYHSTNTKDVVNFTGGDGAHNNMPPYLVVYMWKRTS